MIGLTLESNIPRLQKKIRGVFDRFPKETNAALLNSGSDIAKDVKRKTPKQSGSLARSIRGRLEKKYTVIVKSRNSDAFSGKPEGYVDYVENGTGLEGPHKKLIKPKKKKALFFIDNGQRRSKSLGRKSKKATGNKVFAMTSKGFKGFKMFEEAEKKANEHVRERVIKMLDLIARKISG